MKEFMSRELTWTPKEDYTDGEGSPIDMSVMRYRTSNGGAGIHVRVGSQTIRLDESGCYEMMARDLAELIDEASNNACHLPKAT